MIYVVTRMTYEDAFINADTPKEAMEYASANSDELYWYRARRPNGDHIPETYLRVVPKEAWSSAAGTGPGICTSKKWQ